ncbi:MAG: methionine synthase [Candidatus Nanopelagicales bacterium]
MTNVAPAAATGIGSLPGTDSQEWSRTIAGELPDFPHIPELPARGPGADLIGRTMALLADVAPDLAVETTPVGWRLADAPGRVMSRARSWLAEDLDGVEQALAGRRGPLKAQLAGPWTLAAAVETRGGERAVRDHGACRDIAEALAEAAAAHVREIQRRLPGAAVVLQLDEPSLPSVLAGGVTTASGLATYRAVDPARAQSHLAWVIDAAAGQGALPGVHCCHPRTPIDLLRRAGARMLSVDPQVLDAAQEEPLGSALESDVLILLGYAPSLPVPVPDAQVLGERMAAVVLTQYSRWGIPAESANAHVALTPSCGLAGADPAWARLVYAALGVAGRLVRDDAPVEEQS